MPWGVAASVAGAAVTSAMAPDAPGASGASQASELAAMQQQVIANEQWARYKQIYGDAEQVLADESKNYGSIANKNEAAQDAAANVAATYASLKERLTKNPGINRNSQAYLNKAAEIGLSEAATSAAAQTKARQNVEDVGYARLKDTVSLGNGLQSAATGTLGAAQNSLQSVGGMQDRFAQSQYREDSAAAAGIGRAVGGIFSNQTFQNWLSTPSTPAATPTTSATIAAPADYGAYL